MRSKVYAPPASGAMASPAQALCDYVYLMRRKGVDLESAVTLRNLATIDAGELDEAVARYPRTVQQHVRKLMVA